MTTSSTSTPAVLPMYLVSPPISPTSITSGTCGPETDRTVRELMNELDQSIFKNVSSALSTYFLDINNPGHFVSMPHLGCCASPESNQIMRLVEENLAKGSAFLFTPSNKAELGKFGDMLLQRISSEPKLLSPLSKVLIVLRIGKTELAARAGHQFCVSAMVPEYPLYVDAQIQVQTRPAPAKVARAASIKHHTSSNNMFRTRTHSLPSQNKADPSASSTDIAVVVESMTVLTAKPHSLYVAHTRHDPNSSAAPNHDHA